MRKQRLHTDRILAIVLLWVFSLTLAPWSLLHKHEAAAQENCSTFNCKHQVHIKAHPETCLICTAHFDRDYIVSNQIFDLFLHSTKLEKADPAIGTAYTTLITTALRGPPASV